MRLKTIPTKIVAVIAALALAATIMAPTASAAAPAPAQGTQVAPGQPIALAFIGSALLFLPGLLGEA